ncbi:MAG TPA: hypothetical protein VKU85_18845 [bacterium]|nr:hypothetical protein [bacterium]
MTLEEGSTVSAVALAVGSTLLGQGIRAVLTGGACVSIYTRGAYHSKDVDFVLPPSVRREELDNAMATAGFARQGDRYEHPRTPLYVEFPAGPLAIGQDVAVRAVEIRRSGRRVLALSATDCCRDRLAAFYHWNDRQSLRSAVLVALENRVRLAMIREWSGKEGASSRFEEFRTELASARKERRARK